MKNRLLKKTEALDMANSKHEKENMKKNELIAGFGLLEMLISIVLFAGIMVGIFKFVTGKKEDISNKSAMNNILQELHIGATSFSSYAVTAKNDFNGLTNATIAPFLNTKIITYDAGTGKLNPVAFPEITIDVLACKDISGIDNRRYKTFFDLSALKAGQNWDNAKTTAEENSIAKYFEEVTADEATIGGTSTAIGAVNVVIADTTPDGDGRIAIGRIK